MPRTARASVGGICYHVINRGNRRARVFRDDEDYATFLDLLAAGHDRLSIRVVGFCLMPNHFHLILWPRHDGDLSRWMQWLLTAHVRRHHGRHRTDGHVWQGRFKAFPIQHDEHLLTVLRYVERNAMQANLVTRAEEWPWSSLHLRVKRRIPPYLSDGPVKRPRRWTTTVNTPIADEELEALRSSVNRGAPYGRTKWQRRTAARLGLESSLRPTGRPRTTERDITRK